MEEKSHLLQAENLHVKKAKKPVIRGISLEIKAGEWLAVTGPSGSGKSALLSLLSGKGRPSKGSISLNGREVRPHQLRRETALVSQQPLFWDSFYLELQFILGLRLQGVPEKEAARRVREALNDAELSFAGRMFPSHLSRGQLLQAAFARVLMRRSRILLLDDPFSAMDAQTRQRMFALLEEMRRQGTSIVYASSRPDEAFGYAQQAVLMRDGRILQAGTPRQLMEQPESLFAARFTGRWNLILGEVSGKSKGRAALEAGGVTLDCAADGTEILGQKMALCIDREALHFGSRHQGRHQLSGVFRGVHWGPEGQQAQIELADGQMLFSRCMPEDDCYPGSLVFLWWDAHHAPLIPMEEDEAAPDGEISTIKGREPIKKTADLF